METHLTPFANDVITDVQDRSVDRGEVVAQVVIELRRRTATEADVEYIGETARRVNNC